MVQPALASSARAASSDDAAFSFGNERDRGALQLHGNVETRTEIGGFDVAAVAQRVAPRLVVDGGDTIQVIERGGAQSYVVKAHGGSFQVGSGHL